MRIAKTFGIRTVTPKEVRRKFILVFEGEKTEYQYFKGIDEYKAEIGISGLVDIKQLLRSAREKSTSNPKRVIGQLIKHLKETVASGISCDSLIERICDFIFYELEITEDSIFNSKVIHDDLLAFSCRTIGLAPESIITDVNALLGKFEGHLKATYNVENAAQQIKAGIDLAIEQEKQFCQELVGLKNELGSNVGLLITEMRR